MIELRWAHPWRRDDDGSWYHTSAHLEYRYSQPFYRHGVMDYEWSKWQVVENYIPPKPE